MPNLPAILDSQQVEFLPTPPHSLFLSFSFLCISLCRTYSGSLLFDVKVIIMCVICKHTENKKIWFKEGRGLLVNDLKIENSNYICILEDVAKWVRVRKRSRQKLWHKNFRQMAVLNFKFWNFNYKRISV